MRYLRETVFKTILHQHDFVAHSLPDAKKVCRNHFDKLSAEHPNEAITIGLRERTAMGVGRCIAYIDSLDGLHPIWRKPEEEND